MLGNESSAGAEMGLVRTSLVVVAAVGSLVGADSAGADPRIPPSLRGGETRSCAVSVALVLAHYHRGLAAAR